MQYIHLIKIIVLYCGTLGLSYRPLNKKANV